jgi:ABC-type transporter Mla subunit MlaD
VNRPRNRNSDFWLGCINGVVLASVFWFILWWAVFP